MTREEQIIEAGKIAAEGKEFSVLVNRQHRTMSAYEIGFIEGAEWADQHPNWISVEDDGNPIDTGWYIFTTGKIVDVGYYLGGNEWRDVHPTHWMPMPATPRKEERNEQLESDHQGSR